MHLLVLPGDGIGPEIVAAALQVPGLRCTSEDTGFASLESAGTAPD